MGAGLAGVVLAAVLAAPAPAAAADPSGTRVAAASSRAQSSNASAQHRRLKLDRWVDPYGRMPVQAPAARFEERVEVRDKAMDPLSLTERLGWWLRDFDPVSGAVARAGSAPTHADMHAFRPATSPSASVSFR